MVEPSPTNGAQRPAGRCPLVLFRHQALALSEGFIDRQASNFVRYAPRLVAIRRGELTPTLPLVTPRHSPFITEASLRATRRSPWLTRTLAGSGASTVVAHFAQDAWRVLPSAHAVHMRVVAYCHGSDVLIADQQARQLSLSARQLAGRWQEFGASCDLFLPASRYLAEELTARGVPAAKVRVAYVGVETGSELIPWPARRRDAVFVGRLVRNKGADLCLSAAAPLVRSGLIDRVVIAGGGPEASTLMQLARTLGLNDAQVWFPGAVSQSAVRELLSSSIVACVPSRQLSSGVGEGLGLVALEAQAVGTPVVVTSTGGLPETVVDGVTGVIAEPDVEALRHALARVVEGDAEPMGAAGAAWVGQNFDIVSCARRVECIVRELENPGSGPPEASN